MLKKSIIPVLAATVWISISEFIRNEFLLKSFWTEHYQGLGLTFPSESINGAIWGLWSLLFVIGIRLLADGFGMMRTTLTAWFMGFVLMWVVTANMAVLPLGILWFAVPLSLLEAYVATLIIFKLSGK